MAYYDALIAKWAQGSGTTAQKLVQINALTVATGVPVKALLTPSQILNACVPADIAALSSAMVTLLALLLSGSQVDASVGTTVRTGIQTIFAGKTTTLSQLGTLVAPFDNPVIPWWESNGYASPISPSDLAAAGGLT